MADSFCPHCGYWRDEQDMRYFLNYGMGMCETCYQAATIVDEDEEQDDG